MRNPRMPNTYELNPHSRRVVHRVIHRVSNIISKGCPGFTDRCIEFEALLLIPHLSRFAYPARQQIQPFGHDTVAHLWRVVHGSIDLADLAGIDGVND